MRDTCVTSELIVRSGKAPPSEYSTSIISNVPPFNPAMVSTQFAVVAATYFFRSDLKRRRSFLPYHYMSVRKGRSTTSLASEDFDLRYGVYDERVHPSLIGTGTVLEQV